MVFEDVKKAVDGFSLDELRQLREYIEGREQQIELRAGTVDVDALLSALADIRAGMTEEAFAEIERAMNEEYIEPLDAVSADEDLDALPVTRLSWRSP